MAERIVIFDTTLRDGEQAPGCSLDTEEKYEIAKQLARLGVDVIEAGFPIASPGDFEAVQLVAREITGPSICGLARAREEDIDRCWEAIRPAAKPRIHTFLATSDIHLKHKLKMSREQALETAEAAVKRAKGYCEDVEFSPEDAARSDIDYLCQVVQTVITAGATTVNIPDTVGYSVPHEFGQIIATLFERVPNIADAVISIHCHNDLGLAVANSLEAVRNGARQVECTINGLGERAGNASLEEVVMALRTRQDLMPYETGIITEEIYRTSRLVSDLTGMMVQANKAIVGRNAFAHEAGIHQHGVLAERTTYEIMQAESIGLPKSKLVLGKHSGRHAVEERLRELGYELEQDELNAAFQRFKRLADAKKEVFDADLEAIIADEVYHVEETLKLEYFQVVSGMGTIPTATVKLIKNGREVKESAIGVGTVDAVYKAIREIAEIKHDFIDFSVESISENTEAMGKVTVKIASPDGRVFAGRGADLDVMEAAAKAYVQALNKLIYHTSPGQTPTATEST